MLGQQEKKTENGIVQPDKAAAISPDTSLQLSLIKFISCIAVIYIHAYTPQYEYFSRLFNAMPSVNLAATLISQYLARIAVPAFFCVSGYIYFAKQYEIKFWTFAARKGKSILLPFLLWNTLTIGYIFLLQLIPVIRNIFPADKIVVNFSAAQWLNAYAGIGKNWYPFLYPLWFLPYLFMAFMTVHLFRKYIHRHEWIIWIVIMLNLICSAYVPLALKLSDHRALLLLLYALAYFSFGKLFLKYKRVLESLKVSMLAGVIFIAGIILDFHYPASPVKWVVLSHYSGLLFIFSATGRVVICSEKIQKTILFLAKYTFLIYLCHEFALTALQALIYPILPFCTAIVSAVYILLPLGLASVLILNGWLLQKLFPKVYNFLFDWH